MSLTTRDKLIHSAYEQFYRQGFHAVGLEHILRQAGVTKTTFYNHFDSKEALILAVMQWRNELWPEHLRNALRARAGIRPRISSWRCSTYWTKCGEQKATAAVCSSVRPPSSLCRTTRSMSWRKPSFGSSRRHPRVGGLTAHDPRAVADELKVLMAGSYAQSQMDDP